MKTLNELAVEAHAIAEENGWHDDPRLGGDAKAFHDVLADMWQGTQIALIQSELSEALEAVRKERRADLSAIDELAMWHVDDFRRLFERHVKDTLEDELADAIIRILDFARTMGIDIERHVELKMKYNALRPYRHGGKRF
ncbi:hypothetical protein [uncultured Rikenella sp.]|uniref:hypothetical protein n=1 Tax=uncultured Rikenella sp. TaxID=368003 RepID=UPI00272D53D3|nr:hypothetical protein [uncultured Rikenella sp.]